ncbi:phosphotransferase [Candidatus Formimonas warabiya]|uniref:Aminoglycoside phosphotransferase domain-containing protein n=1 Tax=Formimonas warabiya TaxID=1761012 RepID=A0A3G1KUR8_FORW1|nr:phosphotransferase [Candidatus Formimonas warabiya]ATW26186.1 hypothetical protein DCMF_16685 [Candidatus Formimonas warabiya]
MASKNFVEMETQVMKHYPRCTAQMLLDLHHEVLGVSAKTDELAQLTKECFFYSQIREIVEGYYDLGTLVDAYQIFGGYINTTFGIYTEKDGEKETWLFRKYKRGKEVESLLFEHKLLLHARKNGFSFGAIPIKAKNGKTYHVEKQIMPEGEEDFYFAVFNYIGGSNKYDWIPNWADDGIADTTILSAAISMAQFHNSTKNFDPEGRHGDNIMDNEDITVNDIIKKFPQTLKNYRKSYADTGYENAYTEYFDANYNFMSRMCAASVIPDEDYVKMISVPCHCDFHPGNFKYTEDGTVCGSFDYDMAKIDSRLFEIGLAMHYCFASWKSETNGSIRLERVKKFIDTYNTELSKMGGLAPMNGTEKKYLYEVIVQGALYVIGWCSVACVYNPTLNPYEYLFYTQHLIACLHWLEDHESEIRELSKRL